MRVPPPASHPQIALTRGFDHCWVLDQGQAVAAELYSPSSGVRMAVKTNLPGLQVYGAYHFRNVYPDLHGLASNPRTSRTRPITRNFPSSILRPGETHRSFMSFTFSG